MAEAKVLVETFKIMTIQYIQIHAASCEGRCCGRCIGRFGVDGEGAKAQVDSGPSCAKLAFISVFLQENIEKTNEKHRKA